MRVVEIGIYKILNTINDKIYIGSSNNIKLRFYQHKYYLINLKHSNPKLQSFINKYGIDTLIFEFIEPCNLDMLLIREQWYLDNVIRWGYDFNICKDARSCLGIKRTEEQKLRHSLTMKGRKLTPEHIDILRLANIGRKRSQTVKDNLSKLHKGKTISQETIAKLAKKINQYDLEGNFIKTWISMSQVERETNISSSHIPRCCKSKNKSHGGFQWEYYEGNTDNIKPFKYTVSKEVLQTDFNGNIIREFKSKAEAARELKISVKNVTDRCKDNANFYLDYILKLK